MLTKIATALKNQKSVNIVTHINPDGDALGSAFGLKFILEKCGVSAKVILSAPLPDEFAFTGWTPVLLQNAPKTECIVGVDFGEISRTPCSELFENTPFKIIIDHHIVKQETGDLFFSNPSAAANGENIFRLMQLLDVSLDANIALALYIALMTDTGGCRFSCTTKETHLILSELIDFVDHAYVNRMVFDVLSRGKFEARRVLLGQMESFYEDKINVFTAGSNFCEYDLNGLVNIAVNVEGALAGIIFKQRDENSVKVSLRTVGNLNAAEICAKFSGGGHANAAGATIYDNMENAKKQFISYVEEKIKEKSIK